MTEDRYQSARDHKILLDLELLDVPEAKLALGAAVLEHLELLGNLGLLGIRLVQLALETRAPRVELLCLRLGADDVRQKIERGAIEEAVREMSDDLATNTPASRFRASRAAIRRDDW